ncbi:MAG: ATP-binding cassette domain-containing protein [Acidobacteria bacterium]|nr:ATP-binding cassette domain-containing protein [Acidobacteriota bacterium]
MIEVHGLTKSFGGRPAIRKVTFNVGKGEILGFLGPNGAGKTTTMRILTCYMPPDEGSATIGGFDVFESPMEVKRRIGYLPENPPVYPEMSVRAYLEFVARIRKVPSSQVRQKVSGAIERCGLAHVASRVIGNLSKGFRQRVGLAQAILHDPPVLILDEPTVGLDPEQIIEIRNLIKSLGGERTIILSTHILPEVTVTCSRVAIISYGEIVQEGSLEGLAGAGSGAERLRVRVARDGETVSAALRQIEGVASVAPLGDPGGYLVEARAGDAVREEIARATVRGGWGLVEMTQVTRTLEEIYLEATRRIAPAAERGEPSNGRPAAPVGTPGETLAAAQGGAL